MNRLREIRREPFLESVRKIPPARAVTQKALRILAAKMPTGIWWVSLDHSDMDDVCTEGVAYQLPPQYIGDDDEPNEGRTEMLDEIEKGRAITGDGWRDAYKASEQSTMQWIDRYSELARALGFPGDPLFGDVHDHARVLATAMDIVIELSRRRLAEKDAERQAKQQVFGPTEEPF